MEAESCLQEHTASRSFSCLEEIQETTSFLCCTKPCMSVAPGMTSIITHHYREHRASQTPAVLNGNSRPLSVSSQHTSSYLYGPAGEVFVHSETPDFLESFRAQKPPPPPPPALSNTAHRSAVGRTTVESSSATTNTDNIDGILTLCQKLSQELHTLTHFILTTSL